MGKVKKLRQEKKDWWVYILECADKTLYTGSTNDLVKRLKDHNDSKVGAKYTRSRRPLRLVYREKAKTRGAALRREIEIKKLKRGQKVDLVYWEECGTIGKARSRELQIKSWRREKRLALIKSSSSSQARSE